MNLFPFKFRESFTICLFYFCLALELILFFSNQAVSQWITKHNPLPQPNVPQPPVLSPIIDPVFGTSIIRLTNALTENVPGIVPQYSRRQAWNSDETLMLLITGDGNVRLYDGQNYNFIRELSQISGDDIFWHPFDPNLIFFTEENRFCLFNLTNDSVTILHTFINYDFINTRGEGNISNDARLYAFVGQTYDSTVHFKDIVVYDILNDSIIATLNLPETLEDFDWVSISPSGNYVVVDYANTNIGRFNGVEVYDKNLNFLWQKPLGAGHSDLTIDESGNDALIIHYYDENLNTNFIKKYRLLDGLETTLLEFSWDFDCHISCRNISRNEWCFVSTFDSEARLEDDSLSWLPFEDEIFALKLDGSGEVQRIAHHHSRRFSPQTPDRDNSVYWAEPHASVSRTGSRIVFGSNWRLNIQSDTSVDAYIVDFRNFLTIDDNFYVGNKPNKLLFNSPNPFSGSTRIYFNFNKEGLVKLDVFDVSGAKIKTLINEFLNVGDYVIEFSASNMQNGVYYYILNDGENVLCNKMIIIK